MKRSCEFYYMVSCVYSQVCRMCRVSEGLVCMGACRVSAGLMCRVSESLVYRVSEILVCRVSAGLVCRVSEGLVYRVSESLVYPTTWCRVYVLMCVGWMRY